MCYYCRRQAVYPSFVTRHPSEANQFAIALSDGSVKVMEPLASEGKWGESPPVDIKHMHAAEEIQR